MKNYDLIVDKMNELQDLIGASEPCECKGLDGYVQALSEAITHIIHAPIGVTTQAGEDAVRADRERLVRDIQARLDNVTDKAEEPEDKPNTLDQFEQLLEMLGFKRITLN